MTTSNQASQQIAKHVIVGDKIARVPEGLQSLVEERASEVFDPSSESRITKDKEA